MLAQKINTITYYKGGPGAIAPESQGKVKNGCFSFPCNDVDSDSC